jgi:RNA polymerase sigma factor (sigma-70 family)
MDLEGIGRDESVDRKSFPLTRWSLVLGARGSAEDARRRLGELFTVYWSPLHSFLRRKGCSREDAEDLTQEFLVDLLRRDFLEGIDPQKGKFRSFLLASLEHFLSNDRAKKRRLKRGGGHRFFSLLADQAERRYLAEPSHQLTAEKLFEKEWARTLMDQAAERLRALCITKAMGDLFEVVWPSIAGDESAIPHAELARRLGKKEGAVRVLIHRLRRRYGEFLREEVARTVSTPEEIEEELAALRSAT